MNDLFENFGNNFFMLSSKPQKSYMPCKHNFLLSNGRTIFLETDPLSFIFIFPRENLITYMPLLPSRVGIFNTWQKRAKIDKQFFLLSN